MKAGRDSESRLQNTQSNQVEPSLIKHAFLFIKALGLINGLLVAPISSFSIALQKLQWGVSVATCEGMQ